MELILYDNGLAFLMWDKGNIDHNSNDHRFGKFEETQDHIKVTNISYNREKDEIQDYVFKKNSDGTLYHDDVVTEKSPHVREKVLWVKKEEEDDWEDDDVEIK